jgi:hypothetical protein
MRTKIDSKDNMIAEMFENALHLEEPWDLTHIEFDDQDQSWHLFIDFKRGSTFSCPLCGASSKAYDAEKKSWRHLDFWDWKTFMHARFLEQTAKSVKKSHWYL